MTVLPIYVTPHPVLKKKADPVAAIDGTTRKLMDDMLDTMYAADGIGLAAPQVGVSLRVIVMDLDQNRGDDLTAEQKRGKPQYFVNPEIIWTSEEMRSYNEGCLSIPGQYADVERPDKIRVRYLDYDGHPHEIEADGLLSTCLQHEIDHIDGVLFIDHLSALKRDMILRKLKKFLKENAEDFEQTHVL